MEWNRIGIVQFYLQLTCNLVPTTRCSRIDEVFYLCSLYLWQRVLIEALEKSHNRGEWDSSSASSNTLVEHLYRGFHFTCHFYNETQGFIEDFITCTECKFERTRLDTFFDISLPIRDVNSLDQALDKYVEPELLNGEFSWSTRLMYIESNQYMCGKCNKKVDAKKGLRFKDLPNVFCLQLKRFDFDWETFQRIKLNNRVEVK